MRLPRPRSWMQWARRASQVIFLGLFIWLVLATHFVETGSDHAWVKAFFWFDPLVLAATWLSTHEVAGAALLALITFAATILLGRFFCGWICPLGAVHQAASWFRRRPASPAEPERRSRWQHAKYVLLIALLVMAAFGVHWIGIFDPLSLLYRSITAAVLPAVQYIVDDASTAVYQADPTIGSFEVTSATEPVYEFFRDEIFVAERQTFTNALVIGLVFVGIVALNLVRPRFWCRYACPLGAGLGLLSKRTSLRLENRTDICNQCGRCNLACPAAAQPDVPGEWLPTECYVCWNCVAACSFSGLKFHFEPPWKRPAAGKLDLGKRAVVGAGLAGVLGIFLLRLTPTAQARRLPPELVRPPGALAEREFLQRCIQCGACMRVCPTNALHPAGFVGGAEAAWTPRLIAKIGACEYNCNLCTQVCPTEAIQPLPLEEKQERKIGLASFDTGRCLPYAYGRNCAVCEEHCPVPDKAIYFVDVDVETRDGGMETLLQPRVDPDKCIGCGMCEWSCVFQDKAAIRVTRANESRNPDNQPILPDFGGDSPYGF